MSSSILPTRHHPIQILLTRPETNFLVDKSKKKNKQKKTFSISKLKISRNVSYK